VMFYAAAALASRPQNEWLLVRMPRAYGILAGHKGRGKGKGNAWHASRALVGQHYLCSAGTYRAAICAVLLGSAIDFEILALGLRKFPVLLRRRWHHCGRDGDGAGQGLYC